MFLTCKYCGHLSVNTETHQCYEVAREVYEEAIKVATERYAEPGWCSDYKNAALTIAREISALKDKLNQRP